MKKLSSTLRIKRRYLLIEANSKEEIEKIILDYLGILGWAKAAPVFVEVGNMQGFVLAIDRKELVNIRAAFELAKSNAKIIKVSGTLKGLKSYYSFFDK